LLPLCCGFAACRSKTKGVHMKTDTEFIELTDTNANTNSRTIPFGSASSDTSFSNRTTGESWKEKCKDCVADWIAQTIKWVADWIAAKTKWILNNKFHSIILICDLAVMILCACVCFEREPLLDRFSNGGGVLAAFLTMVLYIREIRSEEKTKASAPRNLKDTLNDYLLQMPIALEVIKLKLRVLEGDARIAQTNDLEAGTRNAQFIRLINLMRIL
jgi:hypothetical protein